jgi:hypothetical protein
LDEGTSIFSVIGKKNPGGKVPLALGELYLDAVD